MVWGWRGEREGSRQGKRKLKDSIEAMLPKSLGASDSEIQGIHHDNLWLRGFLSLTHPRTEATLVPYCPVASVFPDGFWLFLHVIHTYKYHNILRSRFSWRFQSLRDSSGSKGPTFPDVFQMCGIRQTEMWDIDFRHRIRVRFLIVDVSRI